MKPQQNALQTKDFCSILPKLLQHTGKKHSILQDTGKKL